MDPISLSKNGLLVVSGKGVFKLLDTFGFPLDLVEEVLKENGCIFDMYEFIQCALQSGNFSFSKLLRVLSVLSYYDELYFKKAILYVWQKGL